ncbi:hypothetical protein G6F35_016438 [Rhizopus arrhizus]|nr:hypothetical protein G6F35_016438 [Rhizopus arrhizus]KAG1252599.1 hypothetical protein G6F65_017848 [Rhizopus arrhizus]
MPADSGMNACPPPWTDLPMPPKRLAKMLAATLFVAVSLSACGGDDSDDPPTTNPEPPVTEQPTPPAPLLRCAP